GGCEQADQMRAACQINDLLIVLVGKLLQQPNGLVKPVDIAIHEHVIEYEWESDAAGAVFTDERQPQTERDLIQRAAAETCFRPCGSVFIDDRQLVVLGGDMNIAIVTGRQPREERPRQLQTSRAPEFGGLLGVTTISLRSFPASLPFRLSQRQFLFESVELKPSA